MAALAYVLLPVTGALAFFLGSTRRVRVHGLQAIGLGVAWPAALIVCARFSVGLTQAVWLLGAALWLGLMGAAALGRDLHLPALDRLLGEPETHTKKR